MSAHVTVNIAYGANTQTRITVRVDGRDLAVVRLVDLTKLLDDREWDMSRAEVRALRDMLTEVLAAMEKCR